tara:strand:- start:8897 stop:14620 length:5724 start_codon:yes stop_codon:yes gene_type:complete
MVNAWISHLKEFWSKNKGKMSYKEAMKEAKKTYTPKVKGKSTKAKSKGKSTKSKMSNVEFALEKDAKYQEARNKKEDAQKVKDKFVEKGGDANEFERKKIIASIKGGAFKKEDMVGFEGTSKERAKLVRKYNSAKKLVDDFLRKGQLNQREFNDYVGLAQILAGKSKSNKYYKEFKRLERTYKTKKYQSLVAKSKELKDKKKEQRLKNLFYALEKDESRKVKATSKKTLFDNLLQRKIQYLKRGGTEAGWRKILASHKGDLTKDEVSRLLEATKHIQGNSNVKINDEVRSALSGKFRREQIYPVFIKAYKKLYPTLTDSEARQHARQHGEYEKFVNDWYRQSGDNKVIENMAKGNLKDTSDILDDRGFKFGKRPVGDFVLNKQGDLRAKATTNIEKFNNYFGFDDTFFNPTNKDDWEVFLKNKKGYEDMSKLLVYLNSMPNQIIPQGLTFINRLQDITKAYQKYAEEGHDNFVVDIANDGDIKSIVKGKRSQFGKKGLTITKLSGEESRNEVAPLDSNVGSLVPVKRRYNTNISNNVVKWTAIGWENYKQENQEAYDKAVNKLGSTALPQGLYPEFVFFSTFDKDFIKKGRSGGGNWVSFDEEDLVKMVGAGYLTEVILSQSESDFNLGTGANNPIATYQEQGIDIVSPLFQEQVRLAVDGLMGNGMNEPAQLVNVLSDWSNDNNLTNVEGQILKKLNKAEQQQLTLMIQKILEDTPQVADELQATSSGLQMVIDEKEISSNASADAIAEITAFANNADGGAGAVDGSSVISASNLANMDSAVAYQRVLSIANSINADRKVAQKVKDNLQEILQRVADGGQSQTDLQNLGMILQSNFAIDKGEFANIMRNVSKFTGVGASSADGGSSIPAPAVAIPSQIPSELGRQSSANGSESGNSSASSLFGDLTQIINQTSRFNPISKSLDGSVMGQQRILDRVEEESTASLPNAGGRDFRGDNFLGSVVEAQGQSRINEQDAPSLSSSNPYAEQAIANHFTELSDDGTPIDGDTHSEPTTEAVGANPLDAQSLAIHTQAVNQALNENSSVSDTTEPKKFKTTTFQTPSQISAQEAAQKLAEGSSSESGSQSGSSSGFSFSGSGSGSETGSYDDPQGDEAQSASSASSSVPSNPSTEEEEEDPKYVVPKGQGSLTEVAKEQLQNQDRVARLDVLRKKLPFMSAQIKDDLKRVLDPYRLVNLTDANYSAVKKDLEKMSSYSATEFLGMPDRALIADALPQLEVYKSFFNKELKDDPNHDPAYEQLLEEQVKTFENDTLKYASLYDPLKIGDALEKGVLNFKILAPYKVLKDLKQTNENSIVGAIMETKATNKKLDVRAKSHSDNVSDNYNDLIDKLEEMGLTFSAESTDDNGDINIFLNPQVKTALEANTNIKDLLKKMEASAKFKKGKPQESHYKFKTTDEGTKQLTAGKYKHGNPNKNIHEKIGAKIHPHLPFFFPTYSHDLSGAGFGSWIKKKKRQVGHLLGKGKKHALNVADKLSKSAMLVKGVQSLKQMKNGNVKEQDNIDKSDVKYFDVANGAYDNKNDRKGVIHPNFKYIASMSSTETCVYMSEETKDLIVGFRGTANLKDATGTWGKIALGNLKKTKRFEKDLKEVMVLKDQLPNYKIVYTGHSLGGSLAVAMVSHFHGDRAVVFNAGAGLGLDLKKLNIKSYTTQGDAVSMMGVGEYKENIMIRNKSGSTLTAHGTSAYKEGDADTRSKMNIEGGGMGHKEIKGHLQQIGKKIDDMKMMREGHMFNIAKGQLANHIPQVIHGLMNSSRLGNDKPNYLTQIIGQSHMLNKLVQHHTPYINNMSIQQEHLGGGAFSLNGRHRGGGDWRSILKGLGTAGSQFADMGSFAGGVAKGMPSGLNKEMDKSIFGRLLKWGSKKLKNALKGGSLDAQDHAEFHRITGHHLNTFM